MLFIKIVHDILEKLKKKYIEINHVTNNKKKKQHCCLCYRKIIYICIHVCVRKS